MRFTAKKVGSILLVASILFILSACEVFAGQWTDQNVSIGLKYGSSASASYIIQCDSGLMIAEMTANGFTERLSLPSYSQVTVSLEGGGIAVRGSDGTLLSPDIGTNGCIVPLNFDSGSALKLEGVPYRGGICFYSAGTGKINAINRLNMDQYVYGVLDAEMSSGSPMEALKAQAVAARSFAACNTGTHKSEGFDLCNTTHCQVYTGYGGEYPDTNQATDETAGLVITYNGKPATGYYYKNSGGHTQSVSDVWGSTSGYLIGVHDEYAPSYPWNASFTFNEIRIKLEASGYTVGNLQSVSILKRNAASAVSSIEFKGTAGTAVLEKDKVRVVFGHSVIKSTMFSISNSQTQMTPVTPLSKISVKGKQLVNLFGLTEKIYVIGADGTMERTALEDAYVVNQTLVQKIGASASNTGTAFTQLETVSSEPVVFSGLGYGHGVGMSQDSAMIMAKEGFTFEEILKYYYTGIEIE